MPSLKCQAYRRKTLLSSPVRLFNAFERPVGTSSGHNAVWHGCAPYNPAMVQRYLTTFRAVNNWVHVSEKDGKTPAMRLGLANKSLGGSNGPIGQRKNPRKRSFGVLDHHITSI